MNFKNEWNKPFGYYRGKMITLKEYVILEKLKDEFDVEPAKREDVEIFVKRHYLKTFPAGIKRIYAIYQKQLEGRHMVGMIIYGTPFMTAPKFLEPEVNPKEVLELKRLYIDDIGIKNLESYVIGQSLNLLKRDEPTIKVVLTFADDLQGHVGGIYQATNAIYLGKSDTGKHKYAYIIGGNNMKAIKAKLDSIKQEYPKKPLAEALTPGELVAYQHYGNFVFNALMGRNPDEYYTQHQKEIDAVATALRNRLGPQTGSPIYRGIILDPSEVQNGIVKGVPEVKYVSFTENKDVATAFADTQNPMAEFMRMKYPNKKGYLITKTNYDPKQLLYHHSWSKVLPMHLAFDENDIRLLEKQKEVMLKPENEYKVTPIEPGASKNYWVGESKIIKETASLTKIPPQMYHGTIESRANKIWKYGLSPVDTRNYAWSKQGVYLTTSPAVAKHFGDSGNHPPEDASGRPRRVLPYGISGREDVIILTVSTKGLDPKKFKADPRVENSLVYFGTIPVKNIIDWKKAETLQEISREDFAKHLDKIGQLSPVQIAMKRRIRNRIEYARIRKDHIARGKCIHDENEAYVYSNKVKSLLCKDCIETRYNPKQTKALFNLICPHCLTYKLYYLEKDKRMSTLCRVCDKIRVGKYF
jgi:hypothetical protein